MRTSLSRPAALALSAVLAAAALAGPAASNRPPFSVASILGKELSASPTDFAVSEKGALVVEAGNELYDVGGRRFLARSPAAPVSALAFVGGALFFVSEGRLQVLEKGKSVRLLEIPLQQVKLAAMGNRLFIAGQARDGRAALFVYERARGYQRLIDLPEPVDALCAAGDRLYFSIGPAVFSFRIGEKLRMEAALPGFKRMGFLAVDGSNQVIFLSEGKSVYAILPASRKLVLVFADAGGALGHADRSLYLLASGPPALYELKGLSESLASGRVQTVALRSQP